jgi:hypothetical protein
MPGDFHSTFPTSTKESECQPLMTPKLSERFQTALDAPKQIVAAMTSTNKAILAVAIAAWIVGIVAIVLAVKRHAN